MYANEQGTLIIPDDPSFAMEYLAVGCTAFNISDLRHWLCIFFLC